jgi:hypothetical protein
MCRPSGGDTHNGRVRPDLASGARFSGVFLSADLKTLPAIAYSRELTGATDTVAFYLICLAFPLLAVVPTMLAAVVRTEPAGAAPGNPRRGGGGPPDPGPAPVPPAGGRRAGTDHDGGLPADLASLDEQGPGVEQDRLVPTG